MIQEGLRRVSNMSPGVPQSERNLIMSEFMNAMRVSGYDDYYRLDVLKSVMEISKKQDLEVQEGTRVRNRTRGQIKEAKDKKEGRYANTWFMSGTHTAVLNVPSTPGGKLAAKLSDSLRGQKGPDGGTTKVVESGGSSISRGLTISDPFKSNECPFNIKCCSSSNTDCTSARIVYRIDCNLCCTQVDAESELKVSYAGTSGHSLHKRLLEHQASVFRGDGTSALAKHHKLKHGDIPFINKEEVSNLYTATVIKPRVKFNIQRYVAESLVIDKFNNDPNIELINSKSEWGNNRVRGLEMDSSA